MITVTNIVSTLLRHKRLATLGVIAVGTAMLVAKVTGAMPVSLQVPSFFLQSAGFDISWTLIPFVSSDPYLKVFLIGVVNTLFLATIAIVLGTVLGTAIAAAKLYGPWPMVAAANSATALVVNTPFVLQIFVWYFGIFSALPQPRQSFDLSGFVVVNNRGFHLAAPFGLDVGSGLLPFAIIATALLAWAAWRHFRRPMRTGTAGPLLVFLVLSALCLVGLVHWEKPVLVGFNYRGGWLLSPGLSAMILALTVNNAGYTSEIIRSGLNAVPRGQFEAGRSLGLSGWRIFTKIVLPQAMRIVVPPMIGQLQDVLKNCSLAVIVGYPELVTLWVNISLNQSGHAAEIIVTTMLFYVASGLILSWLLSSYRAQKGLSS